MFEFSNRDFDIKFVNYQIPSDIYKFYILFHVSLFNIQITSLMCAVIMYFIVTCERVQCYMYANALNICYVFISYVNNIHMGLHWQGLAKYNLKVYHFCTTIRTLCVCIYIYQHLICTHLLIKVD